MQISPLNLARFEQAKEQFKQQMCLDVDRLFNLLLTEQHLCSGANEFVTETNQQKVPLDTEFESILSPESQPSNEQIVFDTNSYDHLDQHRDDQNIASANILAQENLQQYSPQYSHITPFSIKQEIKDDQLTVFSNIKHKVRQEVDAEVDHFSGVSSLSNNDLDYSQVVSCDPVSYSYDDDDIYDEELLREVKKEILEEQRIESAKRPMITASGQIDELQIDFQTSTNNTASNHATFSDQARISFLTEKNNVIEHELEDGESIDSGAKRRKIEESQMNSVESTSNSTDQTQNIADNHCDVSVDGISFSGQNEIDSQTENNSKSAILNVGELIDSNEDDCVPSIPARIDDETFHKSQTENKPEKKSNDNLVSISNLTNETQSTQRIVIGSVIVSESSFDDRNEINSQVGQDNNNNKIRELEDGEIVESSNHKSLESHSENRSRKGSNANCRDYKRRNKTTRNSLNRSSSLGVDRIAKSSTSSSWKSNCHLIFHHSKYRVISLDCPLFCCQLAFSTEDEFESHMARVHNDLPFLCPFPSCGKQSFRTRVELSNHFRTSHLDLAHSQMICKLCYQQLDCPMEVFDHVIGRHYKGQFGCVEDNCTNVVRYRKLAIGHYNKEHLSKKDKSALKRK